MNGRIEKTVAMAVFSIKCVINSLIVLPQISYPFQISNGRGENRFDHWQVVYTTLQAWLQRMNLWHIQCHLFANQEWNVRIL